MVRGNAPPSPQGLGQPPGPYTTGTLFLALAACLRREDAPCQVRSLAALPTRRFNVLVAGVATPLAKENRSVTSGLPLYDGESRAHWQPSGKQCHYTTARSSSPARYVAGAGCSPLLPGSAKLALARWRCCVSLALHLAQKRRRGWAACHVARHRLPSRSIAWHRPGASCTRVLASLACSLFNPMEPIYYLTRSLSSNH